MKKKEKAAISAVIAFLDMEQKQSDLYENRKKAYSRLYFDNDNEWLGHGIRNIMSGRKK